MNIYLLKTVDNDDNIFSSFFIKDDNTIDYIKNKLDKGIYIDEWVSPKITYDINKQKLDVVKFWGYTNTFAVNKKTKVILEQNFNNIQFLPVELSKDDDCQYFIVNILGYVDGLDTNKSNTRKILQKYIVQIYDYVFNKNVLNYGIFKLQVDNAIRTSEFFANDEFKKIIDENKLTGLKFKKVFEF